MAGIRKAASVILSEFLEDEMQKNDSELERIAALFELSEWAAASRITGYVEEVVGNMSNTSSKQNFRLSRATFQWLLEYVYDIPQIIPPFLLTIR